MKKEILTKQELQQAADLLRKYQVALDNILYKHGGTKKDLDEDIQLCEDLADKLEAAAEELDR